MSVRKSVITCHLHQLSKFSSSIINSFVYTFIQHALKTKDFLKLWDEISNEKLALFSIGTFFIRSSIIKRFEDHGSVPDRAVAVVFPLLAGIFSKVRYFSRKGNSG